MQKPYRFLVTRVASYAEEGSAFLRRRRIRSQPFARIWRDGGAAESLDPSSDAGSRLFEVADSLLEADSAKRRAGA